MKTLLLALVIAAAAVPATRVCAQSPAPQTEQVRPKITLLGEVANPGVYQLLPMETLPALIGRVGKLDSAGREILVLREGVLIRIDTPNAAKFELREGDVVRIPKLLRRAQIIGAVKSPATYEFSDAKGISIRALIEMAGGIAVDTSKFKVRISVARRNSNDRLEFKERFVLPADAEALDASAPLQHSESVMVVGIPIQ